MRISLKEAAARITTADRWMDLYSKSGSLSVVVHNAKDDARASIRIADDYTVAAADVDAALATSRVGRLAGAFRLMAGRSTANYDPLAGGLPQCDRLGRSQATKSIKRSR